MGCCEYTKQPLRVHTWDVINLEIKDLYWQITFFWHLSGEHWDLTNSKLVCECEEYHFCQRLGRHCFVTQWWTIEESNRCTRKTYFLWCIFSLGESLTAVSFRKNMPLTLKFLNFSYHWLSESNMSPIWANISAETLQLLVADCFPYPQELSNLTLFWERALIRNHLCHINNDLVSCLYVPYLSSHDSSSPWNYPWNDWTFKICSISVFFPKANCLEAGSFTTQSRSWDKALKNHNS